MALRWCVSITFPSHDRASLHIEDPSQVGLAHMLTSSESQHSLAEGLLQARPRFLIAAITLSTLYSPTFEGAQLSSSAAARAYPVYKTR